MGPWAWNHLLAWGGPEMLSRGRGVKNGLQGGRLATCPPHAHLWRQDQPEQALRTSLLAFVRVEALFIHIKQALTQALASCRIITRDTDLDGKKLLSSIDQVLP